LFLYYLYYRDNEEAIRAVFERSKIMVWSDEDNDLSPNEKDLCLVILTKN